MAYENITLKYTTTELLADIIGVKRAIPSWATAATPTNEAVGTGDDSNTQFFLDNQNVLDDSYTLYANAVAMVETTDYSLDQDSGEITLTSAGVTLLSTNALTAKYSYISNGMANSYLKGVLERAEKEVDNSVNAIFTDGSGTNPSYSSVTEIQPSEGIFSDRIIVENKPLIDINSTLSGDIAIDAATIGVATGDGSNFPSTGTIIIGSEVITYTGVSTDNLTGCTRGALGSTAATHSEDDEVHTTVLFRSSTMEGSPVVWVAQPWDTSMYADSNGLIYKFLDADPDPLTRGGVANRRKIIYLYGYNTIPVDIVRLTLLFAKRMLIQDNIGKAMIGGRNEFRPEMFNADMEEIQRIINSYIILPMGNT